MRNTDRYRNEQLDGQRRSTLFHHGGHSHVRHARGAS
jgi:hypothetical protein